MTGRRARKGGSVGHERLFDLGIAPAVAREPWMDDANCATTGGEEFFPPKGGPTQAAKKICGACTVSTECLEYALKNDERFGIWGGLSVRERMRLNRDKS